MTKYLGFADFLGDDTHNGDRSNSIIIETGNPRIRVSLNPISSIEYNVKCKVSGKLTNINNEALANTMVIVTVELPREGLGTFKTWSDSVGKFEIEFTPTRHGEYIIYAVAPETSKYSQGVSDEIILTTENLDTRISLSTNYTELIVDQIVTLTASVTDIEGNNLKGIPVVFYDNDDNLIAQRNTDSNGQVILNKKLEAVKDWIFKAKTVSTDLYNGTSSYVNVNVKTIKHTLSSSINSNVLYPGWTGRVKVENESGKVTANTKFGITVINNGNTEKYNIISDSEGYITTNPFNITGNTKLNVSFEGNEKYNSYEKQYDLTIRGMLESTNSPQSIENVKTAIPFKPWSNLSNMLVANDGKYGNCGSNCYSDILAGRNGSRKTPSPLKFSNLRYDIGENAELQTLTVNLKIRTLSCSSDSANIGIGAPTLKMFSENKLMNLPTSTGKLPFKTFGTVSATLDLTDIDAATLNKSSTYFTIEFPTNTTTNPGKIQIDSVTTTLKYIPKQGD